MFEFTDCFLYLFYIGLYQLNMVALKKNLVAIFCFDEIRRVLLEALLPYFLQNRQKMQKNLKKRLT